MEQSGIKEILNALELHSQQIDKKLHQYFEQNDKKIEGLDKKVDGLESKMDKRFDRLEKKFDGLEVGLRETQETVDFLSSKYVQHEKKLRNI